MRHLSRILICALITVMAAAAAPAHAAPQANGSDSELVAGWLARTLASSNGIAASATGDPNYASTAYAVVGLRAAGVASGQITASATALAATKDDFIGDPSVTGSKTTAIALMILAMTAADLDPSQYAGAAGPRDLYDELATTIHTDGAIGDFPTAYSQSFAILALLTAPGSAPQDTVQWMLAQPCADATDPSYGGYGFSGPGSCTDADPDSTALAIIAAVAAGVEPSQLAPSGQYLLSVQDASGGFVSPFSGANANTTGLSVAALNLLSTSPSDHLAQAKAYLDSLMYGCDLAGDASTSPVVGAMAYDTATRSSNQISPLPADVQADLFQASAQGLFGLVTAVTVPTAYQAASTDVPDATSCPSAKATTTPDTTSSSGSGWWWAGGGVVLVLLVVLAWRFLASPRKP
ncbi:MAG: hypothetical protein FWD75_03330 [Propionibacteriaceae bacterium]|nr:hypothetical protein [Propionibacteriaceae bacterium]